MLVLPAPVRSRLLWCVLLVCRGHRPLPRPGVAAHPAPAPPGAPHTGTAAAAAWTPPPAAASPAPLRLRHGQTPALVWCRTRAAATLQLLVSRPWTPSFRLCGPLAVPALPTRRLPRRDCWHRSAAQLAEGGVTTVHGTVLVLMMTLVLALRGWTRRIGIRGAPARQLLARRRTSTAVPPSRRHLLLQPIRRPFPRQRRGTVNAATARGRAAMCGATKPQATLGHRGAQPAPTTRTRVARGTPGNGVVQRRVPRRHGRCRLETSVGPTLSQLRQGSQLALRWAAVAVAVARQAWGCCWRTWMKPTKHGSRASCPTLWSRWCSR